jgi:endonuclease/exonuclease/phosphatase (EEP) superfamily protein YafD
MAVLRVLSINLLVDRAEPGALRTLLVDADPDVVVTQEMGVRTARIISHVFPHGHLDPRDDFFGLGIATKRPVAIERLDLEERSGWVARLEPDGWPELSSPLDVLDVHLVNPTNRPWGESRDKRRLQIEQIGTFLEGRDGASVIIGDMNATPAWTEHKLLSLLGSDAAAVTGTTSRTWSHFKWGPRLLRIDHAFVAGVQPLRTSVQRLKGSDHLALIVDLEV